MTLDTHTPSFFDQRLLRAMGCPVLRENVRLLTGWRRVEGGKAKWNPLNTKQRIEGFTLTPDWNPEGVRNYAYPLIGIAATIATFASRNDDDTLRYGGILNDLQKATKTAEQIVVTRRAEFERWGTDVGLLLSVLKEID